MKILILTDGKAGHENQSKAFARAMGYEHDILEVHFKSALAKAQSYLYDQLGIHTLSLLSPATTWPEPGKGEYAAVVGTGSGTFYAVKSLAKRLGVKCGVVLYPRGYSISSFDCVLAPAFDRPSPASNVIEIPANLVAADAEFYRNGTAAFREHYVKTTSHELPSGDNLNAVAVIVGGPNKCSTMTAEWIHGELDRIFAAHRDMPNVEFWVTTSRRTPSDVEKEIASRPWNYRLLYSSDHFNPIPAFVSLARTLYVTAESTGMLSESCTSGTAEVHALDNLNPGPHKFRRFVEDLVRGGYLNGSRKIDLSAQFTKAKSLLRLEGEKVRR